MKTILLIACLCAVPTAHAFTVKTSPVKTVIAETFNWRWFIPRWLLN